MDFDYGQELREGRATEYKKSKPVSSVKESIHDKENGYSDRRNPSYKLLFK